MNHSSFFASLGRDSRAIRRSFASLSEERGAWDAPYMIGRSSSRIASVAPAPRSPPTDAVDRLGGSFWLDVARLWHPGVTNMQAQGTAVAMYSNSDSSDARLQRRLLTPQSYPPPPRLAHQAVVQRRFSETKNPRTGTNR